MQPIQAEEKVVALESTIKRLSRHVEKYKRDHEQANREKLYSEEQLARERQRNEKLGIECERLRQQQAETVKKIETSKIEAAEAAKATEANRSVAPASAPAPATISSPTTTYAIGWLRRQVSRLSADTAINIAIARRNIATESKKARRSIQHAAQELEEHKQSNRAASALHFNQLKDDYERRQNKMRRQSQRSIAKVMSNALVSAVQKETSKQFQKRTIRERNMQIKMDSADKERKDLKKQLRDDEVTKRMDVKHAKQRYEDLEREVILLRYSHSTRTCETQTNSVNIVDQTSDNDGGVPCSTQTLLCGDEEWYQWRAKRLDADRHIVEKLKIKRKNMDTQSDITMLSGRVESGTQTVGGSRVVSTGTNTKWTGSLAAESSRRGEKRKTTTTTMTKSVGTDSSMAGVLFSQECEATAKTRESGRGRSRSRRITDTSDTDDTAEFTEPANVERVREHYKDMVEGTSVGNLEIVPTTRRIMEAGEAVEGGELNNLDNWEIQVLVERDLEGKEERELEREVERGEKRTVGTTDKEMMGTKDIQFDGKGMNMGGRTQKMIALASDMIAELKLLAKLRKNGFLSSQEFSAAKHVVLPSLHHHHHYDVDVAAPLTTRKKNTDNMMTQLQMLVELRKEKVLSTKEFTAAKHVVFSCLLMVVPLESSSSMELEQQEMLQQEKMRQQEKMLQQEMLQKAATQEALSISHHHSHHHESYQNKSRQEFYAETWSPTEVVATVLPRHNGLLHRNLQDDEFSYVPPGQSSYVQISPQTETRPPRRLNNRFQQNYYQSRPPGQLKDDAHHDHDHHMADDYSADYSMQLQTPPGLCSHRDSRGEGRESGKGRGERGEWNSPSNHNHSQQMQQQQMQVQQMQVQQQQMQQHQPISTRESLRKLQQRSTSHQRDYSLNSRDQQQKPRTKLRSKSKYAYSAETAI